MDQLWLAETEMSAPRDGVATTPAWSEASTSLAGALDAKPASKGFASGTQLRTYRLAVAATGEYTQLYGGVVATMQKIDTIVSEINAVYERELSIHLELVPNNNVLIFPDPGTDPYPSDADLETLFWQNQSTVNDDIGSANYDIGHLFTVYTSAMDEASGATPSGGTVGQDGIKAAAVSTVNPDYPGGWTLAPVAMHEMGHQFGATHTFNEPDSQREESTAYEPGSGSTLMAYPRGFVDEESLQGSKDEYFHSASFEQIITYVDSVLPYDLGLNVGTRTPTGDQVPAVAAGPPYGYWIPARTPFALTAAGSDPDGDPLTYCWEERDLGPAQTIAGADKADNGLSPLFRSWLPISSPIATFPRSGSAANVAKGEQLPATNRELNFRVSVRDDRGGVNSDAMHVLVKDTGAAFRVTNPDTATTWVKGTSYTVNWDVAGTTADPIGASAVNIYLVASQTTYLLAGGVANDGAATVVVPPSVPAMSYAHVKVQAVDNIFYDVSDADVTIVSDDQFEQNDSAAQPADLTQGERYPYEAVQWDDDWYQIEVTPGYERVLVDYTYDSGQGNIDVALYDGAGMAPLRISNANNNHAPIDYTVSEPGVYLIHVSGDNVGNTYNLTWDDKPTVAEDQHGEPNNTAGDAHDLSHYPNTWLSSISAMGNSMGVQADEDWYRIEVPPGRERVLVDARFARHEGDLKLALYDNALNGLATSAGSADGEYIDRVVPRAGVYFIQVFSVAQPPLQDVGTLYDLWFNTVPPTWLVDEPGDVVDADTSAGHLSLREAVGLANRSRSPGNTITFAGSLTAGGPATIALTSGELWIRRDLSIVGPDANLLTIDAQQGSRVFLVDDGDPDTSRNVALSGLTITGGLPNQEFADGGGIWNAETLTLNNAVVTGNATRNRTDAGADAGRGGGVYSEGPLTLNYSIVSENVTGNGGDGTPGIPDGGAGGNGGGIYSQGPLRVNYSTIASNHAGTGGDAGWDGSEQGIGGFGGFGGGIYSDGRLTVHASTIVKNNTGRPGSGRPLLGTPPPLYGEGGGGIYHNSGDLSVTNSTISDNSTDYFGGGLLIADSGADTAKVVSSTVTLNTATHVGGILVVSGALNLENSIVAKNWEQYAASDFGPDVYAEAEFAATVGASYSLIGVNGSLNSIAPAVGSLIGQQGAEIDPKLGPLVDNGGPTKTHALLPGSPAIDAGDPDFDPAAFDPRMDNDQRGAPFVRLYGGRIDMGAYERQHVDYGFPLVVDTAADENDGDYSEGDRSLREMLGLANGSVGGPTDTVAFDDRLEGKTILLNLPGGGELDITDRVDVTGPGYSLLAVSGNQTSRVFNIDDGDEASEPIRVAISGLAITGGLPAEGQNGGGIYNTESLTLTDSAVAGNATRDRTTPASGGDGGGIYSRGPLTLEDAFVWLNYAADAYGTGNGGNGGGIWSSDVLTLVNSNVSSNYAGDAGVSGNGGSGGGIYSLWHTISLTGSTVSGNDAGNAGASGNDGFGGGIYFLGDTISLTDSTVSGNSAGNDGGGIYLFGDTLSLIDSTVSGNTAGSDGGGIDVLGTATLVNSTVSGNIASDNGGGIDVLGAATLVNSTVSGNTAGWVGGGIETSFFATGTSLDVSNSTIAFNNAAYGGGIGVFGEGTLTLNNSIVAGNTATQMSPEVYRADATSVLNVTWSLIEDTSGWVADLDENNIKGQDPMLGPLADNGGPTRTHALLAGSLAIDAGDPDFDPRDYDLQMDYDQRGEPFSRVYPYRWLDIGAYEAQPLSLVVDTLDDLDDGDTSAGHLSLREAIALAKINQPWADTITFAPALTANGPATITLTGGELAITDAVTIAGPGANLLTVSGDADGDGDGESRIFNVDDGTPALQAVTVSGLTLAYGNSGQAAGGAVRNIEDLTILHSVIRDSRTADCASGAGWDGGGIYSAGNLDLNYSTLLRNRAGDSTASPGSGMGGSGGGVFNDSTGFLRLTASAVSGNVAGEGGAYGGDGGGIFSLGQLWVAGSTISGNNAGTGADDGEGGGINSQGPLRMWNSTVSGNGTGPTGHGGGVEIYLPTGYSAYIDNSTIASNDAGEGGGLDLFGGGLYLTSSAVADNTAATAPDLFKANDATLSVSYSLIENRDGTGIVSGFGTNIFDVDPKLAPLADNGGPTWTHALLEGSPAIDHGFNALGLPDDQRGAPFVRGFDYFEVLDGSGGCVDIGAYERQPAEFQGSGLAFVVDTTTDESDGLYPWSQPTPGTLSLREAIGLANGSVESQESITFHPSLSGKTIYLDYLGGGEDLRITDSVNIADVFATQLAVDGNHTSRVFRVDDGDDATSISVSISGLTIAGGLPAEGEHGGGIYNTEHLTLNDSIVTGNATRDRTVGEASGGDGGGIATFNGTLTLNNCTVSQNTTGDGGPGLFAGRGGAGGGIFVQDGSLTLDNSTVSQNATGAAGRGSQDQATAGGAGLAAIDSNLTVNNSTISGNRTGGPADFGGGLAFDGPDEHTATIRNSTITGNSATGFGGGIYYGAPGAMELTNTIVAGNTAPTATAGRDIFRDTGTTLAASYNLIGYNSGSRLEEGSLDANGKIIADANGNIIGGPTAGAADPKLDVLRLNGGATQTHRLLAGSPARNAGDPNFAAPPANDQRGTGFPRMADGRIDIGAYENHPPTASIVAPASAAMGQEVILLGQAADADAGDADFFNLIQQWDLDYDGTTFDPDLTGPTAAFTTAAPGPLTVAFRVSDVAGASTIATATINITNTPPTISNIVDQTTVMGTPTGTIAFTVGDAETPPGSLTVSAESSNPILVPAGNIVFGGSGANRTVTVTPAAGQLGTATITVTVSDGYLTAGDGFLLTVVAPANTPPTISPISDQVTEENRPTPPIPFTIGDAETPADLLGLGFTCSNWALVPPANVRFGGSGASRTVTVTPAPDQYGTAAISILVDDGEFTIGTGFWLTVTEVPSPPSIVRRLPVAGGVIATDSFNIDVTFSEAVYDVDKTDLVLGGTAAAAASVGTAANISGNTWRFPVSGLAAGVLQLTLGADAGDIVDAAGGSLAPTTWTNTVVLGPGRIAFTSDRDGNTEIYVMDDDGSNPIRLTNNSFSDVSPAFSPDGTKIAFVSNRDGGYGEIYVMNVDGTDQRRLTYEGSYDGNWPADPAFSPDGQRILFDANYAGFRYVYVMDADGSNLSRVVPFPVQESQHVFSPDGSKIAYGSWRDGNWEIYTMNADGSSPSRLTNEPAEDMAPAFNADGSKIAFQSRRDGDAEIYVIHADGSAPTRLTGDPAEDQGPAFSPDGGKIAFSSSRDGNGEIYVINADGSAPTRLTNVAAWDGQPSWGVRVSVYYVNDGNVTDGNDWTTAAGNDANDGRSRDKPKASVQAVLDAYDLEPGDVIVVDAGVYDLTANIRIVEQDSGVRIEGYHNPAFPDRRAVINRGNTALGMNNAIELAGADDVILDHLTITGARTGIWVGAESDGLKVTNSTIDGNGVAGFGILVHGSNAVLSGNTVHDHARSGIWTDGGSTRIIGNTAYGNNPANNANEAGISVVGDATVQGNTVYSNAVGIQSTGGALTGQVVNNLVYANSDVGIRVSQGSGSQLVNNTVYQPAGDAVRIEGGSSGVSLRNNILWAGNGHGLSVAADSQDGLVSDYNDFWTAPGGKLGLWGTSSGDAEFADLTAWRGELGLDAHSLMLDPQFVDPDGGDDLLGYAAGADYGQDDDFHVRVGSPTIDAGSLSDPYAAEPSPNGERLNQGHTGNTPEATTSAAQLVQVLAPNGLETFQRGQQTTIQWRSVGLPLTEDYSTVDIDLLDAGNQVLKIADDAPDDGEFAWTIPLDPALVGEDYRIRITANVSTNPQDVSDMPFAILPVTTASTVVGRHIFYNNSSLDDNDSGANAADEDAIAMDKAALLPGSTGSFAHYTSYSRGINGIMVDIAGLPVESLTAADLGFLVGNGNDLSNWTPAPTPLSIDVSQGSGNGGSDRITMIWPDNSIENTWLQVTILANDHTGLAQPDVFYFGNAIGEAGNSAGNAIVNATDEILARSFWHGAISPAAIDDPYDYNRDGLVNGTDQIIARSHQTNPLTMLRLIRAPAVDAVAQQLAAEAPAQEPLPAELNWLFEFQQMNSKDRAAKRSKTAAEVVDKLLASYWE